MKEDTLAIVWVVALGFASLSSVLIDFAVYSGGVLAGLLAIVAPLLIPLVVVVSDRRAAKKRGTNGNLGEY